uniref:Target of rapamycin complex subunit lst8 n=1 Tax=Romanomermis culicivorax TaxID=13658 RepID=A0A915HFG3_ROMCU
MLAAVNSNGVCFLWNMVSSALPDESTRLNPKIKVQKELHNRYALKCRFSPDATLLATTSADQTCRVWRTADFSECATLKVPGQRWNE